MDYLNKLETLIERGIPSETAALIANELIMKELEN